MTAGEEWSLEGIRSESTSWTLSSDAQMLEYMQSFSESLLSKLNNSLKEIEDLVNMTSAVNTSVNNTFNDFNMLSNVQFLESRVYEDDETAVESVQGLPEVNQEEDSDIIAGRIRTAVEYGLTVMDAAFDVHSISPDVQGSDSEDSDSEQISSITYEPVMEPKDPYLMKILPYIIGSSEYCNDDSVGLQRFSETDDEDEESSEDEDTDSLLSREDTQPRRDTRAGTVLPEIPEQGAADNDMFNSSETGGEETEAPRTKPRSATKQSIFDDEPMFSEQTKKKDIAKAFDSIFDSSSEEEEVPEKSNKPSGGVSIFGDVDIFKKKAASEKEAPEGKKVEPPTARSVIPPPPKKGLFSSSSSDEEPAPVKQTTAKQRIPKQSPAKQSPARKVKEPSIFDDDSDDEMFTSPAKKAAVAKGDPFSLLESSGDDEGRINIQDIEHTPVAVTSYKEPQATSSNKKEIARDRAASKSIADELNAKLNKSMTDELNTKLNRNKSEPEPTVTAPEPLKRAAPKAEPLKRAPPKTGLFDSDDEDMFVAKVDTPAREEPPKAKASSKPAVSIFDDSDSDDMFSVKPRKSVPVSEPEPPSAAVKQKAEPKPAFQAKGLFDDSDSDDMFAVAPKHKASPKTESKPAEPTPKAVGSPKFTKPVVASIFDDSDSDDMFASIKPKAAPIKVKNEPVVGSLFDDSPSPTKPSPIKVQAKASKDSFLDNSLTETSPTASISTDSMFDIVSPVKKDTLEDVPFSKKSPPLQSEDEEDMFGDVKEKPNINRDSLFEEAKEKPNVSKDTLFDDSPPSPTPPVAKDNLFEDKPSPEPLQSPKITGISHSVFESPPKTNMSKDVLSDDDRLFESPPKKTVDRDNMFDDSPEKVEPSTMGDDLFGDSPPEEAPIKKSRDSLFGDDMFNDPKHVTVTQDDDIFGDVAKPANNANRPLADDAQDEVLSNKNKAGSKDDFDLFGDVSPRDRAKSRSKSKPVDPEFDLFADTSAITKKPKKSKNKSGSRSRSGSTARSRSGSKTSLGDEVVQADVAEKPSRKPVGGVSMFGGVDIVSALKAKSNIHEKSAEEETPPTQEDKPHPPEEKKKKVNKIAKLQGNLNISASMLQGRAPTVTTEQPTERAQPTVLHSVTKSRAKGRAGRRPPSRGVRKPIPAQEAAPSTPVKLISELDTSSDFFSTTESPYKASPPKSDIFSTPEVKHSTPTKPPPEKEVDIFDDDFDLFSQPTKSKKKSKKSTSNDAATSSKKKATKNEKKNFDSLFEDPLS